MTQNDFITYAKENGGVPEKLTKAVIKQVGGWEDFTETAQNVSNCPCGAAGGFPGFTYYSDTVPFALRYRAEIKELLWRFADDMGESIVDVVLGFNSVNKADREDVEDVCTYLGTGPIPSRVRRGSLVFGHQKYFTCHTIPNLMAWYALEEVCRAYSDCVYEQEQQQEGVAA
jgi:hypothetical protein